MGQRAYRAALCPPIGRAVRRLPAVRQTLPRWRKVVHGRASRVHVKLQRRYVFNAPSALTVSCFLTKGCAVATYLVAHVVCLFVTERQYNIQTLVALVKPPCISCSTREGASGARYL